MEVKKITPEREALLTACGFGAPPDGEDTAAFEYRSLALDTRMSVSGDHTSDHAYIHYAETDELCGFFYAPSLLEHLMTFHRNACDAKRMVREIRRFTSCDIELVFIHGYPMIFTPMYENDTTPEDVFWQISDMLKIVGQLDFLLSRKRDRIRREEKKNR